MNTVTDNVTKEQPTKFNLRIGATSPKISQQIKAQGFKYDKDAIRHIEKCCDCILVLKFAGILTPSECNKAQDKIAKNVINHIKNEN